MGLLRIIPVSKSLTVAKQVVGRNLPQATGSAIRALGRRVKIHGKEATINLTVRLERKHPEIVKTIIEQYNAGKLDLAPALTATGLTGGELAIKLPRSTRRMLEKAVGPKLSETIISAALQAGLTLEQMVDLFASAYSALPAALQAGLTPKQIVDLFGKIAEITKKNIASAYSALPAALQAGLTLEQMVDLFGEAVKIRASQVISGEVNEEEIGVLYGVDDIHYEPRSYSLFELFQPGRTHDDICYTRTYKCKILISLYEIFSLLSAALGEAKVQNKLTTPEILQILRKNILEKGWTLES